eukprot:COSAG01_NODE_17319_length_1160_cov_1.962300_1_plen_350_part_10
MPVPNLRARAVPHASQQPLNLTSMSYVAAHVAQSPPVSPVRAAAAAKSKRARDNATVPPRYSRDRRSTVLTQYRRLKLRDYFSDREIFPMGGRHLDGDAEGWELVKEIAEIAEWKTTETLACLQRIHADPDNYNPDDDDGRKTQRIKRQKLPPGHKDRQELCRLAKFNSLPDATEFFNEKRRMQGDAEISETCARNTFKRMGSKTQRTPHECMQSKADESKWKDGSLIGCKELESRLKAGEEGKPTDANGYLAIDPRGTAYWDESSMKVLRRPLSKFQRLFWKDLDGNFVGLDEVDDDDEPLHLRNDVEFEQVQPRMRGKYEKRLKVLGKSTNGGVTVLRQRLCEALEVS